MMKKRLVITDEMKRLRVMELISDRRYPWKYHFLRLYTVPMLKLRWNGEDVEKAALETHEVCLN